MKKINKKNRFILIQLPICIFLILLIFEILAYLLSDFRAISMALIEKSAILKMIITTVSMIFYYLEIV